MGGFPIDTERGEREPAVQRKTGRLSLCCRLLTASYRPSWLSAWLSAYGLPSRFFARV